MESAIKFVEKVTKALIKQQNFSNYYNKTRNIIWLESYFNVVIGAGFLLFPIVLLIVYFDLSPQIAPYFIGFVIIIAKILLFYKCFSNFFNKFHGAFHLILYFCALEILPDFVLWKGIILANNILLSELFCRKLSTLMNGRKSIFTPYFSAEADF